MSHPDPLVAEPHHEGQPGWQERGPELTINARPPAEMDLAAASEVVQRRIGMENEDEQVRKDAKLAPFPAVSKRNKSPPTPF